MPGLRRALAIAAVAAVLAAPVPAPPARRQRAAGRGPKPTRVRAPAATVAPYSGPYNPFTQLTADYLNGVADPGIMFGPEDKFVECDRGTPQLVFVDLDVLDGVPTNYKYDLVAKTWSKRAITAVECPDPGEGALLPRNGGYTVGTANGPTGDRLLILGGTSTENNVYYSDNCGDTWFCYDGDQVWDALTFAPVIHQKGLLPLDPVIMAGGMPYYTSNWSVAMYLSYDMGITWQRPQCYSTNNCAWSLGGPDTKGWCTDAAQPGYWAHCYRLPAAPALPGGLAADWFRLYLWMEPLDVPPNGAVYYLDQLSFGTGWKKIDGATDGGFGRKAFIRGKKTNSGCWFSTDYLAEDLWVFYEPSVQSTNEFATSPSATGPWTFWSDYGVTAPWAPRASAALMSSDTMSVGWFASGLTFVDGREQLPSFGDAWEISVSVCLLSQSNGLVCSGNGVPDLDNVVCVCNAGFSGDRCQAGSAPAPAGSSAGAAIGATVGVLGAAAVGVFVYARYFGGGPRVAGALSAIAAAPGQLASYVTGGGRKYATVGGAGASGLVGGTGSYTSGGSYAVSSGGGGGYGAT